MFGLGYSVGTFDFGYPSTSDTTKKVVANAVDLSGSFSFLTVGVGSVISGTFKGKFGFSTTEYGVTGVADAKHKLDGAMTGTTSFINFNFGIGPIDLLVGYRMWNTKFKPKLVGTYTVTQSGSTDTVSIDQPQDEANMDFNQITAGIGFGF